MSVERIFIVGDKFAKFSENEHVIPISELESMLESELVNDRNVSFLLGQGISETRAARLLQRAGELNKRWILDFDALDKSSRKHVHKRDPRNSMIGMPRRLDGSRYEVDVLLDDECAEMSDHVTGQHIQGMVLTEAARQTFLAVTEEFFLKEEEQGSYFVINNMDVEYLRFVFPLPMTIVYEILEHKVGSRGSQRFDVRMAVMQNQEVCCIVKTKFSTYYDAFIQVKEGGLAIAAIHSELFPEILHEKRA